MWPTPSWPVAELSLLNYLVNLAVLVLLSVVSVVKFLKLLLEEMCLIWQSAVHDSNTAEGQASFEVHSFISSPEPSGSQGELIVYPSSQRPSVGVRPPSLKIFSSEIAWPIKAIFYVEPPWLGGTKVCINGPGHMTKMAAMPIYGENLKKSSSPEPAGRFP